MRSGGNDDTESEPTGLEIIGASGSPPAATELTGSAETDKRSRTLAIVLGVFVVGWMALALLSPQDTATDSASPTTERDTANDTTTLQPPTTSATTTSSTPTDTTTIAPAIVIPDRVALSIDSTAFEDHTFASEVDTVRVAVAGTPPTVWELNLSTKVARQFDLAALSPRSRIGLRFVDPFTLYGFDEVDRHVALIELADSIDTPAVEAHSFRPGGGAPTGLRGLDRSEDGSLAMWATASSGLTRYLLVSGEPDAQWSDPDRNFALTPEVRGVSDEGLIVQSPVGTNHTIDDQGRVRSLPTQAAGRIEVVAGSWALVTSCDEQLNCEEVRLVDLTNAGRTAALGPWRSFVPECALADENGFVAAGVNIEGALVIVEYDNQANLVSSTQLAEKSLACVDLARVNSDRNVFVVAQSRGGLIVVDTEFGRTAEVKVGPLGGKAVSVAGLTK